ncbi:hypothetical protein SEEE2558_14034 [Salmonella enterica subsp. enterica serovar Enteritidis str. 22558]|nr:hypothetical protein SEEE2558_14034 [Salmonella enterica subsp. enterica serovar Enteritidis str. 22558]
MAEPWDIGEGGYQVGNFRHRLPSGTIISRCGPPILVAA